MRWRWSTPGIRRYSDHVLDLFGPERVMAASNWPVILLGASYEEAWRGIIALSVASKSPPANACLPTAIAGLDRSILRALIRVVDQGLCYFWHDKLLFCRSHSNRPGAWLQARARS
jgi:hypothetical protein